MIHESDAQIVRLLNPHWQNGIESDPFEFKNVIDDSWPAQDWHDSTVFSTFLVNYSNSSCLPNLPWILARDGYLPLLLFFKRNPSPINFHGQILIHHDFKSLIPISWKNNSLLYKYQPLKTFSTQFKSLVLCGLNGKMYCSLKEIRDELSEIKSYLEQQNKSDIPLKAYFVPINSSLDSEKSATDAIEYILEILNFFPNSPIEWLSHEQFKGLKSDGNSIFYEFNSQAIISESAFSWQLLSTGFYPLKSLLNDKAVETENLIPASKHHCIALISQNDFATPPASQLKISIENYLARCQGMNRTFKKSLVLTQ